MRTLSTLSAAVALALLFACASSRDVEGLTGGASGCIGCHGGLDNQTGAPPFDVAGLSSSAAVGAHTPHLAAGVACASCHRNVNLSNPSFPNHQNGTVNVDFGPAAVDPNGLTTPLFVPATLTCSNVYCHAPSTVLNPGAGPAAPRWNQGPLPSGCGSCHQGPGTVHGGTPTLAQCVLCHAGSIDATGKLLANHANGKLDFFSHPSGWAVVAANGTTPHGLAATYQSTASYPAGLAGCRTCHGADLSTPIANAVPNCNGCHAVNGVPVGSAWQTTCTFCHGDRTRTLASAQPAPPRDVAGNTSGTAAIGAHQAHLLGKVVSSGVGCTDCHGGASRTLPPPTAPASLTHVNGATEVTLKRPGQNAATGTFDPGTLTCATSYCHGNLPRNPVTVPNNPLWTDVGTQSACSKCHAANGALCGGGATCTDVETGLHEKHRCARCHGNSATAAFSTQVGCFACHGGYQRQLGTTALVPPVVNFAYHVDGAVEVIPTTSPLTPLSNPITITITYTAPSGTAPANCTTNCHTLGAHNITNPQFW